MITVASVEERPSPNLSDTSSQEYTTSCCLFSFSDQSIEMYGHLDKQLSSTIPTAHCVLSPELSSTPVLPVRAHHDNDDSTQQTLSLT